MRNGGRGGGGGKTKSVSEASRGSENPASEADGAGVPVEIFF